jgi:Protein of unknown function (DUF3106)
MIRRLTRLATILGFVFMAGTALAQGKAGPSWSDLKPTQQQVLAPIQGDWAAMDAARKRKWLGVANRYPTMNAEEQERVNRRIAVWAALSPAERNAARNSFREQAAAPAEKRQQVREKWDTYQELPEEKRRELSGRAKRGAASTVERN